MATAVLITRQTLAAEAADRWAEQYRCHRGRRYFGDAEEVLANLRALGPLPSPDAVDRVIGNTSWTSLPACNGCGNEDPGTVVRVGEEPDYESRTAYLCSECIASAAVLIKSP